MIGRSISVMIKNVLVRCYKSGHRFLTKRGIKIKILYILNRRIIRLLRSDFTELDGHKLYLDPKDSLRLSTRGYHEPYIREIMQQQVRAGDVVVDLGANIGNHTLLLAKLVGKTGRVYAFEPHPHNFALLKKNVEANGYTNVVVEQKAVSDRAAKIKLYLGRTDRTTQHSIIESNYVQEQYVEVETVKLDDYFKGKSVNFIKMDIEGAEHYAVLGMKRLLKNPRITLLTEFTPFYLQKIGIAPEEHIRLLQSMGFTLLNINEQENTLEPFDVQQIPVYITERFEGSINTNILCYKGNKVLK